MHPDPIEARRMEARRFARTSAEALRELVAAEAGLIGWVFAYAVAAGLLAVATPVAVQALVSTVAFGGLLQPIFLLSALLLGCLALMGALQVAKAWIVELVQRRLFLRTTRWLAHRIPAPARLQDPLVYAPERVNRVMETFILQKSAASLLLDGIDAALAILVGMIVLAFYHPFLLAFDLLLLAGLAGLFALGRNGAVTALAESSAKYRWLEWIEARAQHADAARAGPFRANAAALLDDAASAYLDARAAHYRVVLRQLMGAVTLQAIASATLMALGGFLVVRRELTLGQLVAAEIVVAGIVGSIARFGKHAEHVYDAIASASKLDAVDRIAGPGRAGVDPRSASPDRSVELPIELRVEARAGAITPLAVPPRGVAVLTVPADATADDIAAALRGARTQRATANLAGIDAAEWSDDAIDHTIVRVRRPEVFPGTVLTNLTGQSDLASTDALRVQAVVDALSLRETLDGLPAGWRTALCGEGAPLSEEARLRLSLARATLATPAVLHVDRALDPMGEETAASVAVALRRLLPTTTLLVTSARPEIAVRLARALGTAPTVLEAA